ncbi:excalibur calcium-binding domain-containing protein [Dietzia cinnamea]|nr:excalibur calcium-binding domain-containing protein [Dietzia cinnamea]
MLFAAIGMADGGALASLAEVLVGLAVAGPGGWWILCERRDRTRAEEDYRLDREAALAAESMAGQVSADALSPLTWSTPLAPYARRWPLVGSVSAAALVAGAALMPATAPTPVPAASPAAATGAIATSTVTSTVRTTTTTTVTRAPASTSSAPATPVASEPEPAPASTVAFEPTYAPAPAQTYAPAPVAEQEPQSAYYQNCSAARAAGAAPLYRGQPGYASKLDRDNDGVACE